jgi:hypothetical protein
LLLLLLLLLLLDNMVKTLPEVIRVMTHACYTREIAAKHVNLCL